MRLLVLLFLFLVAVRPMPVMAAMPAEAHVMMMAGGEAEHCDDQDSMAFEAGHCTDCCLTVLPHVEFGDAYSAAPLSMDHMSAVLAALYGHTATADPPPPRA